MGHFSFRVHLGLMHYYRNKVANRGVKLRMKYIIVDPEENSGNDLQKILDDYEMLDFKGNFTNIKIAENIIHKEFPDIAFIRMDKTELNAFKLARLIREFNPYSKVIFLSSYVEYAVEAFECQADGFLLIPFDAEKIKNLLLISFKKRNT